MSALALSCGLFVVWTLVGYAVLNGLGARRDPLQSLLLGPTVGVATLTLLLFWLSRGGLPIGRFGVRLGVAAVSASVGVLVWCRPRFAGRRYAPFAVVLLAAAVFTGRPMLDFGFDWLSYVNDDMGNYTLGALRLLNHGFFEVPDIRTVIDGRDYSLQYWAMDMSGHRPGSQLLLAWVASITRLTVHQVFMPTIVALHLVMVSAAGGLVARVRRRRRVALLTCGLVAVSALATLGALSQLIAQVSGLGLLAGAAAVVATGWKPIAPFRMLGEAALLGALVAALLVVYPEVVPVLVAGAGLHVGLAMLRRRRISWRSAGLALGGGVAGAALVGGYLTGALGHLGGQFDRARVGQAHLTNVFPYYLVPSGLADLWGLQTIGGVAPEPWMSVSIAAGSVLLGLVTIAATRQAWRGEPGASVSLVLLAMMTYLFAKEGAFGLFKAAMFVQPFVLGVVALAGAVPRSRWWRHGIVCVVVVAAGCHGQRVYVERSRGVGSVPEVHTAASGRLVRELRRIAATGASRVEAATVNNALAKVEVVYFRGRPMVFREDLFPLYGVGESAMLGLSAEAEARGVRAEGEAIRQVTERQWKPRLFRFLDAVETESRFKQRVNGLSPACDQLIAGTGEIEILNRRWVPGGPDSSLVARPCALFTNHLLFVPSTMGERYYAAGRFPVGIYKLEADPFGVRQTFAALGRFQVFEVLNPTGPFRLSAEITASFRADREAVLPPVAVAGVDRVRLPLVGRGSARVFSPPVRAQSIGGRHYIGLDMGMDGSRFPVRRTGLMWLYGRDVPIDAREVVVFGRDVSLVSEDDYRALGGPMAIREFPGDLRQPSLEYSGISEDGWIGDGAYAYLRTPAELARVVLRGTIPLMRDSEFRAEWVMLLDGQEVARRTLPPGPFVLEAPVQHAAGRARVEVRASRLQRLGGPDRRPVGAHLEFLGFVPGGP